MTGMTVTYMYCWTNCKLLEAGTTVIELLEVLALLCWKKRKKKPQKAKDKLFLRVMRDVRKDGGDDRNFEWRLGGVIAASVKRFCICIGPLLTRQSEASAVWSEGGERMQQSRKFHFCNVKEREENVGRAEGRGEGGGGGVGNSLGKIVMERRTLSVRDSSRGLQVGRRRQ